MRGRLVEVVIDFSKINTSVVSEGALIARIVFLITEKAIVALGAGAKAARVVLTEVERATLESSIRNRSSASLVRTL